MNVVDCYVKTVESKPIARYGKYWVSVTYDCYGQIDKSDLMFDKLDEALEVKPGYNFFG